MADMNIGGGGFLGLKLATLVAGFAGGVVSLSFVKKLTPISAVLAVITGAAAAGYGTPIILHFFNLPPELQDGCAFFLGLTAMNIIPGIIYASEAVKNDPLSIFAKLRGNKGGQK